MKSGILEASAQDQSRVAQHQHFPVLDGLRGVAALAVVLFHSYEGGGLVPNGPLAVDLFFVMSGFVIANSYGARLAGNMTKLNFIARRFVRLYPMLFVGALGGIVLALLHNKLSPGTAYPMHALLASGGLSLLVLPYLEPTLGIKAFTFNPPIWSLFFEIAANLVYVLIARRLNIAILAVIVLTGLAGVVWYGPLGGGGNDFFIPGFPRVACGFFGGVLLHQVWVKYPSLRFGIGFLPLTVALLALLALPKVIGGILFVPSFLFMIAIVWGAIGRGSVERRPVLQFLGEISYPVYLIHWLTLYLFNFVGTKLHLVGDRYAIMVAVHICAIPFIGYVVAHYYETPVRAWLGGMVNNGRKNQAQPASSAGGTMAEGRQAD